MSEFWYYAEGDDTRGPITFDQLIINLSLLPSPKRTLVWRDGFSEWKAAESVIEIVEQLFRPPPLRPKQPAARQATPGDALAGREEIDAVARYQQQFRKL